MTRGNQRDRDRERAQARGTAKGKGKDDGLTPEQRRERDGKALQEKAAKKAAEGAGSGNSEDALSLSDSPPLRQSFHPALSSTFNKIATRCGGVIRRF
ncbi:hypothetical protein CsSME_00020381 [Camellia sinensis var. sinensis]